MIRPAGRVSGRPERKTIHASQVESEWWPGLAHATMLAGRMMAVSQRGCLASATQHPAHSLPPAVSPTAAPCSQVHAVGHAVVLVVVIRVVCILAVLVVLQQQQQEGWC